MMFSSLRFRMWAAFAAVIFISLLIAGSAFSLLVRNYRAELDTEHMADLAMPIALQVNVLERAGASPQIISSFLQDQGDQIGVRILLVDANGQVIGDTQGNLQGQVLDVQRSGMVRTKWNEMVFAGAVSAPDQSELYVVSANPNMGRPQTQSFFSRPPSYRVILAVPRANVGAAWLEMAPGLSVAAILSLVVSVGVAVLLARSIAGPVVKITQASEAMARGDFEQNISVQGQDEVARLARSFNAMARQVGATNQTLREFLANASHELKTPLTSIQGFSQAMVDGAINEPREYARAAEIVNAEAGRMRNLVDDLLLLSQMEAGEVAMDREPIDLGDILATCLERFRWRAEEQGIELALEVSPDLVSVCGDSRRLEQVFGNLLDNALRYAPRGGCVTVHADLSEVGPSLRKSGRHGSGGVPARLMPVGADGGEMAVDQRGAQRWVRVRVHNTGSWIAPEELPHVFERFYRSRGRPDSSIEGSGLGLAIVREIVEAHDGWVVARSDRVAGTEFEVNLPPSWEQGADVVTKRSRSSIVGHAFVAGQWSRWPRSISRREGVGPRPWDWLKRGSSARPGSGDNGDQ